MGGGKSRFVPQRDLRLRLYRSPKVTVIAYGAALTPPPLPEGEGIYVEK